MYSTKSQDLWVFHPETMVKERNLYGDFLENSYSSCLGIMEVHSKSFYFASRFLPPEQRQSVAALYAFCRLADDIVDESDLPTNEINGKLNQLKISVTQLSDGYISTNPVLHALGDTIRRYQIPVTHLHELIEGVRMDLNKKEYESISELDLYCYRVASTVGLMMTHIFLENPSPSTLARAADLGRAMQLTNILRDIKEDYERGRIYLPKEIRELYGVKLSDLENDTVNSNLVALLKYEIERAKGIYRLAKLGIKDLPPAAAYTIDVASRVYGDILNEIKRIDYQVLKQRAVVSKARKIVLATKVRLEYLREL
ncbi:MAG: phytoene/squalene synthase family protein [Candidatus Hermodarchaeota archaeon]